MVSLTPPQYVDSILHSPTTYSKELNMDTTKWKSIAVSVENYVLLKEMAKENDRSISGQVAHMIKILNTKTIGEAVKAA